MTIYNHKKRIHTGNILREIVFGIEDGMVSTLGSVTGIAIGSQNKEAVMLAGFVIIAVESISMGIGSYVSNKIKQSSDEKKVAEEKIELHTHPEEEREELKKMYIKDGWSKQFAEQMIKEIANNKTLILKEMKYRELQIFSGKPMSALKSGLFMFVSYIIGGLIPLSSYIFLSLNLASIISITITLVGLFLLVVFTSKYTNEAWYRSGLRILIVGGIAMTVGLIMGKLFSVTG